MKKFYYKFLIAILGIGMLCPTWIFGVTKAEAADFSSDYYYGQSPVSYEELNPALWHNWAGGTHSWSRWTDSNDPTEYAMWKFTPDVGGEFQIKVSWVIWTTQTTDARYVVKDKNGENPAVHIDMTKDASGIVQPNYSLSGPKNIGTYQFNAGEEYNVKLFASVTGNVHGDMIQISHTNVVSEKPILITPTNSSRTNSNLVAFDWQDSADIDDTPSAISYDLFISDRSDFSNLVIDKSGANTLSLSEYQNLTVFPDGDYWWYVRAWDGLGYSLNSDIFKFTVNTQAPATPTNLILTAGNGEVTLNWDAVLGIDFYNVYYKKVSDLTFSAPISLTANSTKIVGLENGVKYNFIVRSARVIGSTVVESSDAWGDAIPYSSVAKKVTFTSAPVTTTEVSQAEPQPQEETKIETPTEEQIEEGKIKGEEEAATEETEEINWTPWIILFILIILAGAATGGYFYWFGREEEEEIITKEVLAKNEKKKKTAGKTEISKEKKSKRW